MSETLWHQIRHSIFPYIIAYFGKGVLRLILCTCRLQVTGIQQFKEAAAKKKCILMLWHNRLPLVAEVMSRHAPQFIYAAFISNSRDGEPLAILANSYPNGRTIRVPHNARHQALRKMINHLKHRNDVVVVTPDGPRGPRYEVKPGTAAAAKEAAAAIVPLSWSASRFWQLKTWDKMIFPKPFSTIAVALGKPIDLCDEKENIEVESGLLQEALLNLDKQVCFTLTSEKRHWPK